MDIEAFTRPPRTDIDEPAIEQELAHYLGDNGNVPVWEPWQITNPGQADWALRKLSDATRLAATYQDEITLWTAALRKVRKASEWFEARLKEWALDERERTKRATTSLPHGTVSTRSSQARPKMVDEVAALGWARECCPDAIKTTESFLVSQASVRVVDLVVCWQAVDKATGEQQRKDVDPEWLDDDTLAGYQASIGEAFGDGYLVEPLFLPFVVDTENRLVPGLVVEHARVTASVKVDGPRAIHGGVS